MSSDGPTSNGESESTPARRGWRNRVVVILGCVFLLLVILTALAYHTLPTGHEARFVGRWAGTIVVMTPTGAPPGTPTHPEDWEWWIELRGDGSFETMQFATRDRSLLASWTPTFTGWWQVEGDQILLWSQHPWHPLVHRLTGLTGDPAVCTHIPVRWQGDELRVFPGRSDEFGLHRFDGTWEDFALLAAPP